MSEVSSLPSRPTSPESSAAPENHPPTRPYRFTWDPASRKPGPESVAGTTEGRGGDDFSGPHPLAFLNASSTSLALGSLPTEWSSSRTGFHAISTVLNNPHKRQAPPKPHSTLPTVPPPELPRVRRKDFDSYLRAVAPEWERYERNLQLGQEGLAQFDNNETVEAGELQMQLPPTLQNKFMPPLDSVPSVFFQKDFNLGDPRTFAGVTEQDPAAAIISPQDDTFADPLSLSYSLPLLDKFSHYADTIEQHLVREIFIRSSSFFAALTNLRDLQSESERCLDRITKLRKELNDVDNNSAMRGLELVRKESKMANLGKVRDGVKTIGEVMEMTSVARSLVNAGQWAEALGVIEDVQRLWAPLRTPDSASLRRLSLSNNLTKAMIQNGIGNGDVRAPLPRTQEERNEDREQSDSQSSKQPPHPIALSSLHAFSSLPTQLRQLTMEIAGSLANEFVSVLRNDLELRINSGDPPTDADRSLVQSLKPLLLNLIRTKGLKEGMLSWREVVLVEVSGAVKKIIPNFVSDEDDLSPETFDPDTKNGRIKQLRDMKHVDFLVLIQKVYRGLFNAVERLQSQSNLIIDILNSLGSELNQNLTNIPAVQEDLSDIVSSAAELSNSQAAKIITCRSEQHAALELADFLTFFSDSWSFVIKCETLCRRMIVGLRGTVVGQAKLFLQAFHQTRTSRSAKLVEDELWNPAEITPGLQHIVNIIVDSAVRDPSELVIKTEDTIFSPHATSFPSPAPNGDTAITPTFQTTVQSNDPTAIPAPIPTKGTSSKHLRIEDRSYYTVTATSEVLTLLLDYLRLVINLSMLTTDTMSRVIEFLKAFNSRTCQVVLGAGAMRSAGLRNITARHLALASQSLSIIFELIPYIRETFRRHLSQKQAVMLIEFDKLKRDYQEHQNEIHSKLIAIMGDRLSAHVKSLRAIDWTTARPANGVNEYMEILVKETATLHKVLSRYLALNVVEYVMTQVFAAINHRLSEEYTRIELPTQEAKERLLGDAKYMHEKLSVLKNVGAPTGMLVTLVTEKIIGRGGKSDSNQQDGGSTNSASVSNLARSNTLTTNQRLRGLISAKRPSFMMSAEKALPHPSKTPPPPPPPPASDKPQSPVPPQYLQPNHVYGSTPLAEQFGSVSQISLPDIAGSGPTNGERSTEGSENPN